MKSIIRYREMENRLGMNRTTIWRRTKSDPTFPRPIRLGGGNTTALGFLSSEVEAWLARQADQRGNGKEVK